MVKSFQRSTSVLYLNLKVFEGIEFTLAQKKRSLKSTF